MLKKLMPVMAAPAISCGMRSLIWGYINIPPAAASPNAKKIGATTNSPLFGERVFSIKKITAVIRRQKTISPSRVLNTLSDSIPNSGHPMINPTFNSNIKLPVRMAEYSITSMRNGPAQVRAMVESMVETGRMSGGYMMCIGNHIPWNVTPEGIQRDHEVDPDDPTSRTTAGKRTVKAIAVACMLTSATTAVGLASLGSFALRRLGRAASRARSTLAPRA